MADENALDITHYNALLEKGSVDLQRIAPRIYQMLMRQWDPSSGVEIEPRMVRVNPTGLASVIAGLTEQKKQLETSITNLELLRVRLEEMESAGTRELVTLSKEQPA